MRFFKDTHIDFLGYWKWAFIGSSVLIIIGLVSLIIKGPKYGIDFAGGTIIQVKFTDEVDLAKIRKGLQDIQLGDSVIQQYGPKNQNEVLISLKKTTSSLKGIGENIKEVLTTLFTEKGFEIRRVEMVGPKVGKDLRQQGLWAIIFAIIGILLYAWWRFEFSFSIGAIVALVHDTLITIGAISLTNREFSLPVVAALLTIVGYSINDTIVVYDRVRENVRLNRDKSLFNTLNLSINETLGRTFLTTFTTFLVVVCLFIFGGQVINDFAFALVVGVIIGTYSSMFVASPVVLLIHNWNKARARQTTAGPSEKSRMAAHTSRSKISASKIAAMNKAQKSSKR